MQAEGFSVFTPALTKSLTSKNPEVREMATEALGKIGTEKAVSAVFQMFADPEARVRKAAVSGLVVHNFGLTLSPNWDKCKKLAQPFDEGNIQYKMLISAFKESLCLEYYFAIPAVLGISDLTGEPVISVLEVALKNTTNPTIKTRIEESISILKDKL